MAVVLLVDRSLLKPEILGSDQANLISSLNRIVSNALSKKTRNSKKAENSETEFSTN